MGRTVGEGPIPRICGAERGLREVGSAFEVETQLTIANNVGYINNELFNKLLTALFEIEKQLNGLIHSLRSKES